MLKRLTPARSLPTWLTGVAAIAAAATALTAASVSPSFGLLVALAIVPAAVLVTLWPAASRPGAVMLQEPAR